MASPLDKPKGNEKPTTIQPTNQLLDKRRKSFPNIDSVHLKEKVKHLGTGVNELDVRVQVLENSSPDGKRQKELEQSKQEVCNLKEELLIVRQELEKITAQSEKDQEQLLDCHEKIKHLEKELEEKKAHIQQLESEVRGVKDDLETTKADLEETAVESRATKEELASTKQDLAATKEETNLKFEKQTADMEYLKQFVMASQPRTPGDKTPIPCTEPPPDNAGAQAMVESGQKGHRPTRRDQPQHTVQTSLTSSRSLQRERRAGQNPQAQPPTPRQTRQGSFHITSPSDKPMKYMPGKK